MSERKVSDYDWPWPRFHQGIWPLGLWQRLTPEERMRHAEESERWQAEQARLEAENPPERCQHCGQILGCDESA